MKLIFDKTITDLHPNTSKRRAHIREVVTIDFIKYCYNELNLCPYSIGQYILKNYGVNVGIIETLFDEAGLKRPSYREAFFRSQERRKSTNIKKYGHENPLGSTSIIEKRNKTVKDRYGCNNVFQHEKIKEKIKNTMLDRYGVTSAAHLPDRSFSTGSISKPHKIVSDFLNLLGVEHKNEIRNKFKAFNEELEKEYCPRPDITIDQYKIVIEINGDLWHANPEIYRANDLIRGPFFGKKEKVVSEIWLNDKIRKNHIENFGYKVYVIWETEIKSGEYKNKIMEIINENNIKINEKNLIAR